MNSWCALRAEGKSRVDIAEALRQRYRFNARVALRYAHEWSQRQAADEWNQRWPDELKTLKAFSYWEQWPSSTGHAPTFDNLSKLAELYQCAVSDLLVDLPDFRHRDTVKGPQETTLTVCKPDLQLVLPNDFAVWATATGIALPDTFVALFMQYLGSLALPDRAVRSTPRDRVGCVGAVRDEPPGDLAGYPRIGIDHAVAAEQWARHTGDLRLRAYTTTTAARAYAADGQRDACLSALDTAHTVVTTADDHTPSLCPFYNGLTQARAGLQPWHDTAAVRALDERLAAHGLA